MDSTDQILERIKKLERVAPKPKSTKPHPDSTRAEIAKEFLNGYFFLLILSVIGIPIYNFINPGSEIELNKILLTVSGIVGTPLGFILGYYFKTSEK